MEKYYEYGGIDVDIRTMDFYDCLQWILVCSVWYRTKQKQSCSVAAAHHKSQ